MTDVALFSLDENSTVKFSLRNIDRKLSGPEAAVQRVAKALFTEPGSNLFARQDGGGLLGILVGTNLGDFKSVRADVAISISRTWETIRQNQGNRLAADETITNIELVDLTTVTKTQTWLVKIRISLEDGNSFTVNFEG